MAEEYDYLFKSIVVGDGGVGKTALTLRFSKGFFTEDYKMTIGVDFHVKTISIDSVEGPIRAKLQIWDTGGQERFSSIRPMYYRGSLGALLIFDLTNAASFEHLPQWIEEVRANVKTEIPLLLVGNKSDLTELRAVNLEEINTFTSNFNLYYMETSAKTGEGVGDCFYILACLMIGSGVPDQLISRGIIYAPGQIPISAAGPSVIPPQRIEPEFEYEAPPVPEPTVSGSNKPASTFEPEPEFEYEAPPVPEPVTMRNQEPSSIVEPEFEPEIPLPDTPIENKSTQAVPFDFKTPDEILIDETSEQQFTSPTQPTTIVTGEETYKPKTIPFTNNVPVPAPAPEQFQSFQTTPSVEDQTETKSDSLMDYLPEPVLSKKDKKKLEKQKKKEEKERKLQEEKERQEKLLKEMKKVKKDKKEKPKKEKKEKLEVPEEVTPSKATKEPVASSLFQTLSGKTEETEKPIVEAFVPFAAQKDTETQEASKLRIIPNVSDIEREPAAAASIQPVSSLPQEKAKSSSKEIIICNQCGAVLSSDYAFCNKCGSKL